MSVGQKLTPQEVKIILGKSNRRTDKDLHIGRVKLWLQIREYEKSKMLLAKYFSDDAYEDVKIPEELKAGVKAILWVDSDGSDSQGLIKPDLFGSVRFAWQSDRRHWVQTTLVEVGTDYTKTKEYREIVSQSEAKQQKRQAMIDKVAELQKESERIEQLRATAKSKKKLRLPGSATESNASTEASEAESSRSHSGQLKRRNKQVSSSAFESESESSSYDTSRDDQKHKKLKKKKKTDSVEKLSPRPHRISPKDKRKDKKDVKETQDQTRGDAQVIKPF